MTNRLWGSTFFLLHNMTDSNNEAEQNDEMLALEVGIIYTTLKYVYSTRHA
jgi:hypothetical protein